MLWAPKYRVLHLWQVHHALDGLPCQEANTFFLGGEQFSIGCIEGIHHVAILGYLGIVAKASLHTQLRLFGTYLRCAHEHAIRTILGHGEMLWLGSNQFHIAIDATHESEVGRDRSYLLVGVIHHYQ